VAGAIGAASNNGIGVAGVSWLSRIMPLLVVDEHDFAAYSHIAEAILYAADHGIRIINISIGGNGQSAALQSAVDYAWSKGALIFAPAMNYSVSTRYYPAACDHVIAVSATDSNDHLASFSNYGNWIALAAPGTGILTTANGGGYGYLSGTSFSSPIAAGVAALILAINPSLTNVQLVSLLERSADDIGDPGYDTSFGWGRVNAFRAVAVASQEAPQGEKHAVIPNTIFPRRSRLP
jgi:subtilisin family serine protease